MKVAKVNNNLVNYQNSKQNPTFKGGLMDAGAKAFIAMQESTAAARFVQDTATNWTPKAVFSRSKADLAEMSFTEFLESALFYFSPAILGEHLLRRKVFKNVPKEVNKQVGKTVSEILSNKEIVNSGVAKQAIPIKAGILLGCMSIPLLEYGLSFAKNLFTLKVFKTSNFDKIANLDKNAQADAPLSPEEIAHQKKVKSSAIKHLIGVGIASLGMIAGGIVLAKKAPNSEKLQKFCRVLLEPGKYIAEKTNAKPQFAKFLKDFGTLDLAQKGSDKLGLSKGLLGMTVSIGILGYLGAAKDRSDLDFKEVLTRTPLSGAYAIFGSDLFEEGFKKMLYKNKKFTEKFPDLIKQTKDMLYEVPTKVDLDNQLKQGIIDKAKYNKSMRGKAFIAGVPFAFSLVAMGFFVAGMSRLWTQIRYNKQHKNEENKTVELSKTKQILDTPSFASTEVPKVFEGMNLAK